MRHKLPSRTGSHVAYAAQNALVVEWYDFGEDVPYESANLLIFDVDNRVTLAQSLGAATDAPAADLARLVAARFRSYFDVKEFAVSHGVPCRAEVDFDP